MPRSGPKRKEVVVLTGPRPSHGMRRLRRLFTDQPSQPLSKRLLRRLDEVEAALRTNTVGGLRDLNRSRYARQEMLAQQGELTALNNPPGFLESKSKTLLGVWAALRRTGEFLLVLEQLPDPAKEPPTLEEYLRGREMRPTSGTGSPLSTTEQPNPTEES